MTLHVSENFSLQEFNTFGINAKCRYFAEVQSIRDIESLFSHPVYSTQKLFILGGGSNILLISDFKGLFIKLNNKGFDVIEENAEFCLVKVAAGEVWDDFVAWSVERNLCGAENLSHIPGSVGASPVQNIGAYGVEAKDIINSVLFYNYKDKKSYQIKNNECNFGYRDSIFKNELKESCIVIEVIFKLYKKQNYNLSYANLSDEVKKNGSVTLKNIRNTIIAIRESKLPDPKKTGNAGSFFKNPVISETEFDKIKTKYPTIVHYPAANNKVKIAAGWMIDQLGWKGKSHNGAAVHSKQALVLINTGTATGSDVKLLSEKIQDSVLSEFGIKLETEVIFL